VTEGYIVLFSNSSMVIQEKNDTIRGQNFMDSVLNWKAVLGKAVQMNFMSLSVQLYSWHNREPLKLQ